MSGAFSFGIGIAIGKYMVKVMMPMKIKKVIICQNCAAKNPVENNFCSNCGQRFYPQKIECQKCGESVSDMKFCGFCGSPLKKQVDNSV
jgi:rRNA maturation endonuclease Nob1